MLYTNYKIYIMYIVEKYNRLFEGEIQMFNNKKFKWMATLAATGALLAACGTDDSSDSSTSTGDSDDKAETTKYIAGTEATFAPFEYMDDKGNIIGIDKEIIDAIAEEMGVEIEMQHVGWDPVFEGVKGGTLDLGASGITITPERAEQFDFTDPYYEATQLIVVKGDSTIESLADLEGQKISVQVNTTGHIAAKKAFGETSPNISPFENLPTAILETLNGGTAATIGDNAVVYEYIKNNPNQDLKIIEDEAFEKEEYGFMVKKGNKELLDILNEGLQKIKENGKLKEITGQDFE